MKKTLAILVILPIFFLTGCLGGQQEGIFEGVSQQYYVADLVGDPNNRNIFRATTVWSEDATFELLIPDYWEVKIDKDDTYNTDVYITSEEYKGDSCVILPGTMGYGIPEEYEKEVWYTNLSWGAVDDYFFYTTTEEGERRPVLRIVEAIDGEGYFYVFELRFPEEGDYVTCNADFSDILASFRTLDGTLEETYIEEEIFEVKWPTISIKNKGDKNDRFVVDYYPDWIVEESDESSENYFSGEDGCSLYPGVGDRDLAEAASYEQDVLVLDNNDMAEKYLLSDAEGNLYMEIVKILHGDNIYNFEIRGGLSNQTCLDNAETTIKSFRTYEEHVAAQQGYNIFEQEQIIELNVGTEDLDAIDIEFEAVN